MEHTHGCGVARMGRLYPVCVCVPWIGRRSIYVSMHVGYIGCVCVCVCVCVCACVCVQMRRLLSHIRPLPVIQGERANDASKVPK